MAEQKWWQTDEEYALSSARPPELGSWRSRVDEAMEELRKRFYLEEPVSGADQERLLVRLTNQRFQDTNTGTPQAKLRAQRFARFHELGQEFWERWYPLAVKHQDDDDKLAELEEVLYSWVKEIGSLAYDDAHFEECG